MKTRGNKRGKGKVGTRGEDKMGSNKKGKGN